MKYILSIYLTFLICLNSGQAQELHGTFFDVPLVVDSAYNKLIDFAYTEGMFILSMDKKSNFLLLSKLVPKKKGFFTNGERLSFSFFIREKDKFSSVVALQIRIEENVYKNYVSYYIDRGITDNQVYYDPILQRFKKFLRNY